MFLYVTHSAFRITTTCLPSRKLYKLDEPDTQDTAGEAGTNSSVIYSYGPPHMTNQKQDDQLEHTYSCYVRIQDVTLKTYPKRRTIGRSGERGLGIPVLAARHNDDDDDIYIDYRSYGNQTWPIKWNAFSSKQRFVSITAVWMHYMNAN